MTGPNSARRVWARLAWPVVAMLSLVAMPAQAATDSASQMTGTATAAVVTPVTMTNLTAMRFGSFAQPNTAGTLTLSPASAVSTTGGVTGNQAIAQGSTGPAAGTFQITGGTNRAFSVFGPATFNISNGSATMAVTLLTGSLQLLSNNGITSSYLLRVGGRLSVGANQAVGAYSGSYTLLTAYQ